MKKGNLRAAPPDASQAEAFEDIAVMAGGGVVVERIFSEGQSSPPGFWYDQDWDEWVMLMSGGAAVRFEAGGEEMLGPGDWLLIPAHRRHRVESTQAGTVWLAVHARGVAG